MRVYLAFIVTLLVVVGFGLYTINFLGHDAREILHALEGLDSAMASGDWEQAQQEIDEARKIWSQHKDRWAMVINHQDIDNIDLTMARLARYISLENRILAAGDLAELVHMLEYIPEKEKFNLSNIF